MGSPRAPLARARKESQARSNHANSVFRALCDGSADSDPHGVPDCTAATAADQWLSAWVHAATRLSSRTTGSACVSGSATGQYSGATAKHRCHSGQSVSFSDPHRHSVRFDSRLACPHHQVICKRHRPFVTRRPSPNLAPASCTPSPKSLWFRVRSRKTTRFTSYDNKIDVHEGGQFRFGEYNAAARLVMRWSGLERWSLGKAGSPAA
jgi:hypothetical protein